MLRPEHPVARAQALACLLLAGLAPPAIAAAPFAYKGNGPDGVAGIAASVKVTGLTPGGALDFLPFDSKASLASAAAWSIPAWKGRALQLAESVPLATKDVTLEQAGSGALDAVWTDIAHRLVGAGFPSAFIRLGWEQNGGWYPWAMKGHEQAFNIAFRRASAIFKSASPAFRIVWNPSIYMNQQWPDIWYPGDDVIDVVALDVYNQSWSADALSAPNTAAEPALWSHVYGDSWGVKDIVAFAAKHDKPYAFPEWGTGTRPDGHGGGDDAYFIQQMAPFVAGAIFSTYWNYPAGDYNGRLDDGSKPKALAALRAAFYPARAAPPATQAPASAAPKR